MRARRRRLIREETLAPWLTLVVIVGLWWLGARFIGAPANADSPVVSPAAGEASASGDSSARRDVPLPTPPYSTDAPTLNEAAPSDGPRNASDVLPSTALGGAPSAVILPPVGDDAATPGDDPSNRRLIVPIAGIAASSLSSMFDQPRGDRRHEALDILAPRGTPVVAATEGRVAKLFTSAAGGLTVYQFDAEEKHSLYYAHLDGYVTGLAEGQMLRQGQVLGYVGTTGNAPPDTPHLHFAIFRLNADRKWWEGEPVDPMLFLR